MSTPNRLPEVWAGHWLMAVAVLHTLVAAVLFPDPLLDIARHGIFNSVQRDPVKGVAVWFLLFGAGIALVAVALTSLERQGDTRTLRAMGTGLLLLTIVGVVLMPVSGFWLALPPAIALLMRRESASVRMPERRA